MFLGVLASKDLMAHLLSMLVVEYISFASWLPGANGAISVG